MIRSASSRTFFGALDAARLPHPARPLPDYNAEVGERFLDLIIAGVDHELVGYDVWYARILGDAPDVRQVDEAEDRSHEIEGGP